MQIRRLEIRQGTQEASVTPLELFFDLVFVFALTQVTAYMTHELSWHGVLRGVLVVMLLWWSWTGYAWVANVVSAEEAQIKLVMLVSMAAMFLMALCIPEAFDDAPGGLSGPVVLAICYLIFRLMHLVLFWILSAHDRGLRRQVLRFAPSVLGGTALLLHRDALRGVDADGALGRRTGGRLRWRGARRSLRVAAARPGHFAERHGLIIIVALGESIVAIGVGVADRPISVGHRRRLGLRALVASAMWWAYFDISALLGEHALAREPVETRPRLGRNAYSFAHLPTDDQRGLDRLRHEEGPRVRLDIETTRWRTHSRASCWPPWSAASPSTCWRTWSSSG